MRKLVYDVYFKEDPTRYKALCNTLADANFYKEQGDIVKERLVTVKEEKNVKPLYITDKQSGNLIFNPEKAEEEVA